MAANTGVGGSKRQVQRWYVTVNVRASNAALEGDGAIKLNAEKLESIRNETLRQFCDLADAIETGEFPKDFPTRECAEVALTEDAETETPGYLLTRTGYDPCCGVWGDVKGHTLTVTSTDTMANAFAAYRAEAADLPDDLKPTTAKPQTPPPAQQQRPAKPQDFGTPEPPRSESGTPHLGGYDYKRNAEYAQYDVCSFDISKVVLNYKKSKGGVQPIPVYEIYSTFNGGPSKYPAFSLYSDNEKNPRAVMDIVEGLTLGRQVDEAPVSGRAVVRVVAANNGKYYANVVKVELDLDGPPAEEMPF